MDEIIITTESRLAELIVEAISSLAPVRVSPYMNKKQLAIYLGSSISTVNRLMKKGLPFIKEGNDYPEFYKPEIDRWLENRFVGLQKIQGQEDHAQRQELV